MLQGALTQCRRALKPDGLLLGALLGGESLQVQRLSKFCHPLVHSAFAQLSCPAALAARCRYTHGMSPTPKPAKCCNGPALLQELRIACALAEQELENGVSPRISPLAQVPGAHICSHSTTQLYLSACLLLWHDLTSSVPMQALWCRHAMMPV